MPPHGLPSVMPPHPSMRRGMLAVRIIGRSPIPGEAAKAHSTWMPVGCAVHRSVSMHTKTYTRRWYIYHTPGMVSDRFSICSHTVLYLLKGLNPSRSRGSRGVFCYENARRAREISAIWADLFFITLFFVAIFLCHPK